MKRLLSELFRLGWSENKLMNTLQDRGLISDNCVTMKDIAESDAAKAAKWLATID